MNYKKIILIVTYILLFSILFYLGYLIGIEKEKQRLNQGSHINYQQYETLNQK